jgi:hypothetical protein
MVGKRPCGEAEDGAECDPDADSDAAADEDSSERSGGEAEPGADTHPVTHQRMARMHCSSLHDINS